jgi:hypothetical protein
MLIYLFFWYVILVLWARRSLPLNRRTWITRRFIRAQTSIVILALLIATQPDPLDFVDPPYTSRKVDVSNFAKK